MTGAATIRVIRGNPTDDELAALVCVLATLERPTGGVRRAPSRWAASARPAAPGKAGRGAWRASALPR
jgi:hypothetical protein